MMDARSISRHRRAEAQAKAYRAALAAAGVEASSIGLVEAHGTGTPVGDPLEFASVAEVYGTERPCALGSVKTNFGHTQSAAGALGVMKAVLSVQHGVIPQNLHFTRMPDEMAKIETELFVPQATTAWPTNGEQPRRAAVSAYGLSGTNVHAIVEQAPELQQDLPTQPKAAGPLLFPLSSTSAPELRRTAGILADWVANGGDGNGRGPAIDLADLAYSLTRRRGHRSVRTAVIASGREELIKSLRDVADADTPYQPVVGNDDRGPVWVFSGQGSQWAAMGAELLAKEPVFAATVAELEPLIERESELLCHASDVGARGGHRNRPCAAHGVRRTGGAGGGDEVLRGDPRCGHRPFDGRGGRCRRRRRTFAGRRREGHLQALAADVAHRRLRRDGIGGTARLPSPFGAGSAWRRRRLPCRCRLAAVDGDRRCHAVGSRPGGGVGAARRDGPRDRR